MLYRKHYRMVAIIAGMALTAGMTACGAQNNAEYPESVDTHSTGVYGTSIENEMASAVAGRETQAETSPSQGRKMPWHGKRKRYRRIVYRRLKKRYHKVKL